jgi:predicted nuclease with TOPRIM domain
LNTKPKTIEEFRLALAAQEELNRTLQTRLTTLESENADLEEMVRRFHAKYGKLNAPDRPAITRVDFGS